MITDRERWLMQQAMNVSPDYTSVSNWIDQGSDLPGASIEDQIAHEANVRFPPPAEPTSGLDVADTGRVAFRGWEIYGVPGRNVSIQHEDGTSRTFHPESTVPLIPIMYRFLNDLMGHLKQ